MRYAIRFGAARVVRLEVLSFCPARYRDSGQIKWEQLAAWLYFVGKFRFLGDDLWVQRYGYEKVSAAKTCAAGTGAGQI